MRSSTKRQREEPPVCGEARSTGSSPGDSSEQRSASSGPGWRVSHSGDGVAALSITPSGCVALGLHAGPIVLLSEGGGGTRRLDGHTGGTLALASGKRGFVSAGADGCVRIWSLDSLTLESARSLEGGTRGVHGALVDTLAVSDDDLWAAASGRCVCVGAIDGLLLEQLRLGRSPHPSPSPSPKPDPNPNPNLTPNANPNHGPNAHPNPDAHPNPNPNPSPNPNPTTDPPRAAASRRGRGQLGGERSGRRPG